MSYEEVLRAHFLICDYFASELGVPSLCGVKNVGMLCSAVGRQKTSFGGKDKWTTPFEVMASLFFGLVMNHAFHDGNKRTALLVLLGQLYKNRRIPICNQDEFESMTVAVAEGNLGRFRAEAWSGRSFVPAADAMVFGIADFLRRNTRKKNVDYKPVPFFQFDAAIRRYGYRLGSPSDNFIDIIRIGEDGHGETTVLRRIGFPGMKKVMAPGDIKECLKKLKLTPDNGYDWNVLFGESEPMFQLIHDFEAPLRRLRDE